MFSLILAATIVVSIQVLGVTLISAAIVIPPIVARLLVDNFKLMIILSTLLGSFCGIGGIYASYYIDVSSGASVVLFSALIFILVLGYTSVSGRLKVRRTVTSHERRRIPQDSGTFD